MKIIIEIIFYGISLYLLFLANEKYYETIRNYIDDVVNNWINIPKWLNWLIVILLLIGIFFAQKTIPLLSIFIWLFLLIIMPFFYLPIKNKKIYNFFTVSTFFTTALFSITLFF